MQTTFGLLEIDPELLAEVLLSSSALRTVDRNCCFVSRLDLVFAIDLLTGTGSSGSICGAVSISVFLKYRTIEAYTLWSTYLHELHTLSS